MILKNFFKPTISKIILTILLVFIPRYNYVICGFVSCFEERFSFFIMLKKLINLIYNYNQIYSSEMFSISATLITWLILAYLISLVLALIGNSIKKLFK